jgi:hypothetical protein
MHFSFLGGYYLTAQYGRGKNVKKIPYFSKKKVTDAIFIKITIP